ncbi:MAG TPA: right-handed parallel beta-helix repeat-containing protein, partial [Candidatus Limnocylindrales bacterium]|nr:right-handed parallel beta-helix repeat-containing protein [Candidatus Limnocylindrales bacterium]
MPECTGCEMSFDEKEYINCPYCGLSPENAVEKDNASATMTQPDRKRVKLLIVSLVVFAVIAVLVLMTFMPGDDAISVPDDFPTIQAAIDAAVDGDELVVQLGVYRETIDFNGKNIILRSTNPDDPNVVAQTIINADGNGAVVSFRSGENEGAVLSGFTIMRGSGSGIIVSGGSSPTIEKNIIEDNTAEDGGGIVIYDSSPFIRGNTITGNAAFIGGGVYMENSSPVIEGNIIIENTAEMGGGIAINVNSLPIITGNTVSQNRAARFGGGMVVAGDSAPSIRENTIVDNTAVRDGGGLLIEESEPVIDGNTIAHNMAANGGGIYVGLSLNRPLMIINNMINGNRALND